MSNAGKYGIGSPRINISDYTDYDRNLRECIYHFHLFILCSSSLCYRDTWTREAILPRRRARADFASSRDLWSSIYEDSGPAWKIDGNTWKTRRDAVSCRIAPTSGRRRLAWRARGGPSNSWWRGRLYHPNTSPRWWPWRRSSVTKSFWSNVVSPETNARKPSRSPGPRPPREVPRGEDPLPLPSRPPGTTPWPKVRLLLLLFSFYSCRKKNIHKLELYVFQGRPGTIATAVRLMLVRWKASDQLVAVVDQCWTISPNFERVPSSFWTVRHRVRLREVRHREGWLSRQ